MVLQQLLIVVAALTAGSLAPPISEKPEPAPRPDEARPAASPEKSAPPRDSRTDQARRHFEDGNAAYAAGRYQEALAHFTAGHALVPRPSFLLNLAQTHRQLGHLEQAKELYLDYLRTLPGDSPIRPQIAQIALEIDLQLRERPEGSRPPPPTQSKFADLVITDPFSDDDKPRPHGDDQKPAPSQPGGVPSKGRNKIHVGLGLLGGGVVILGVGVALEVLAKQASDRLSALGPGERFDRATERRGERYDAFGLAALVTGGVAAGLGTGLFLLGRRETTRPPLSFYVAPTASGALVGVRLW